MIEGGLGDDFVITGDSAATYLVSGASGNDTISAGEGSDFYLVGDSGVFTCEGRITASAGNDVIDGGTGDDGPFIGGHNPVCGVPTGRSGNEGSSGAMGTINSMVTATPTRATPCSTQARGKD